MTRAVSDLHRADLGAGVIADSLNQPGEAALELDAVTPQEFRARQAALWRKALSTSELAVAVEGQTEATNSLSFGGDDLFSVVIDEPLPLEELDER